MTRHFMKLIIFLSLMLLIFTAFIMSNKQCDYPIPKDEQLVDYILAKTAKLIKEKYKLYPCGTGVAMPGGPIQKLALYFTTSYPHSKEQLRKLVIKSAHELLNAVTENNEIQEFLKERPFTIKNIEIIIYNHDKDGRGLRDPEISTTEISQGILTSRTIDPENSFRFKNKFEESYEDALKAISTP